MLFCPDEDVPIRNGKRGIGQFVQSIDRHRLIFFGVGPEHSGGSILIGGVQQPACDDYRAPVLATGGAVGP